ncbi:S8 family peptidase [Leuconostoc citreum]|uniref:S8 family peptidase n=1 Tax=Leuconostoc citreum TaxID=33964 RepID=UPI0015DDECBE|nr:S8 family serine peptidase [Leuconostoc citreum]
MIKYLKQLLFLSTISSTILFLGVYINEVSADITSSNISVLVDEKDLKNISDVSNKLGGNEKIKFLSEVGLASVNNPSADELNYIKEKFPNSIIGKTSPIKVQSQKKIHSLLSNSYAPFNWAYKKIISEYPDQRLRNKGGNVTIAVIDSGIDTNHPGFVNKNIKSAIYTTDKNNFNDEIAHGTLVAGVIETLTPKVKINSYKVVNNSEGDSDKVIQAIIDAVKDNVDIINISLSTNSSDDDNQDIITKKSFESAVNYAKNNGVIIVASAGNNNEDIDSSKTLHAPAGLDNVVTVGATQKSGEKASYSNYGRNVTVYAPGGDVGNQFQLTGQMDAREMMVTFFPSTMTSSIGQLAGFSSGYTLSYGTSLSAPEVSSVIASILSSEKRKYRKYYNKYLESNYAKSVLVDNSQTFYDSNFDGYSGKEVRIKE